VESRLGLIKEVFSAHYDRLRALAGEAVSASERPKTRDTPATLATSGRLPRRWSSLDLVASAQSLAWLADLTSAQPRTRVLCDARVLRATGVFDAVQRLLDRGVPVRASDQTLSPMAVVDGARTFIWAAGPAGEPAVVEPAAVAAAFAGVYDVLWRSATDLRPPKWSATVTAAQRRVLQLLRLGLSDNEISRAVGTSPQAVRLHVGRILNRLQTTTRFSAGVAAARLEAGESHGRAPD
jgi:DNA-binding CsgD family transcriptional regulator